MEYTCVYTGYSIWISYTILQLCLCVCSAYFVQELNMKIACCKMRTCALRVSRCELRVASCELQKNRVEPSPSYQHQHQPRGQKAMHPNLHWQQCRRSSKQRYLIHTDTSYSSRQHRHRLRLKQGKARVGANKQCPPTAPEP